MIAQLAFIFAILAITISALIIVSCFVDPIDQASDNRANRGGFLSFHASEIADGE